MSISPAPRILNKLVSGFVGASVSGNLTITSPGEGWEVIPALNGAGSMFRWRGYIDLGALAHEQLTFFLQSATVSEQGTITASTVGEPTNPIEIIDVFSKVPITDDDLNLPTHLNSIYAPGFMDSVQDMDQILWCRLRGYYHDATWVNVVLQQNFYQQIWGEGIGTAASRIHLTRYVKVNDAPDITIPGACFQCVGMSVEEPDLQYIMRLRRDYEIA